MLDQKLVSALKDDGFLTRAREAGESERNLKIVEEYLEDVPVSQIAQNFGLTPDGVRYVLRRVNTRIKKQTALREQIVQNDLLSQLEDEDIGLSERSKNMVRLYAGGKSFREVSEQMGTTLTILIRVLSEFIKRAEMDHEQDRKDNMDVGQYLQGLRVQRGLTLAQAAEQMGFSPRTLMRVESGSLKRVGSNILIAAKNLYKVRLDDILLQKSIVLEAPDE